jgi:hypothetical protein
LLLSEFLRRLLCNHLFSDEKHSCRFLFYHAQSKGKKDYHNANYIGEKTLNFYFESGDSLFLITANPAEDVKEISE